PAPEAQGAAQLRLSPRREVGRSAAHAAVQVRLAEKGEGRNRRGVRGSRRQGGGGGARGGDDLHPRTRRRAGPPALPEQPDGGPPGRGEGGAGGGQVQLRRLPPGAAGGVRVKGQRGNAPPAAPPPRPRVEGTGRRLRRCVRGRQRRGQSAARL